MRVVCGVSGALGLIVHFVLMIIPYMNVLYIVFGNGWKLNNPPVLAVIEHARTLTPNTHHFRRRTHSNTHTHKHNANYDVLTRRARNTHETKSSARHKCCTHILYLTRLTMSGLVLECCVFLVLLLGRQDEQ